MVNQKPWLCRDGILHRTVVAISFAQHWGRGVVLARMVVAAVLLALVLPSPARSQAAPPASTGEDAKVSQQLVDGVRLMQSKKSAEAIQIFDSVAAGYESKYKDKNTKYYSARSPAETLFYTLDAATSNKGSATVVSGNWGYAYYLKAYALLDLGRVAEAKAQLQRAVTLSPQNSQFLSELGHVYQLEKNWQTALQIFQRAESAAKEFSPANARNGELGRAWRGMGFAYVELNRLDDAEAMYRQCLELDKNDAAAMRELRYVQGVKARAK
jgi:Flp pilus assembly protein TadD